MLLRPGGGKLPAGHHRRPWRLLFVGSYSTPMAQRLVAAFKLLTAKEELTNLASYTLFLDYGLC